MLLINTDKKQKKFEAAKANIKSSINELEIAKKDYKDSVIETFIQTIQDCLYEQLCVIDDLINCQ